MARGKLGTPSTVKSEATMVPGFMGADGKAKFRPTQKDMDSNKEFQHMKKQAQAGKKKKDAPMAKEDVQFDEAMSVTLRKSKSQPGSYKVHSVGSKMKAHGGMKPGERVKDHHIDDLNDSGIKVKYRKEMTEYQKGLIEGKYSDKEVRMAKGIAFDKRHVAGDYTGAAKKMEKIKKGLSDHPKAKDALRRANEQYELAQQLFGQNNLQEISDTTKTSYIKKAGKEITNREKMIQKIGNGWNKGSGGAAIEKQQKAQADKRRAGVRVARGKLGEDNVQEISNELVKKVADKRNVNVSMAGSKADYDRRDPDYQKAANKQHKNQMLRFGRGAKAISKAIKTNEAIERRADAKVIMATDPNTGKKIAKKAPRKEIEIGLGKDA